MLNRKLFVLIVFTFITVSCFSQSQCPDGDVYHTACGNDTIGVKCVEISLPIYEVKSEILKGNMLSAVYNLENNHIYKENNGGFIFRLVFNVNDDEDTNLHILISNEMNRHIWVFLISPDYSTGDVIYTIGCVEYNNYLFLIVCDCLVSSKEILHYVTPTERCIKMKVYKTNPEGCLHTLSQIDDIKLALPCKEKNYSNKDWRIYRAPENTRIEEAPKVRPMVYDSTKCDLKFKEQFSCE